MDISQDLKPRIDEEYENILEGQEETYAETQKRKWARLEAIVGTDGRIDVVVKDFLTHYDLRQKAIDGKVMFVAMSRKIAVKLYSMIVEHRPEWHSDEVDKGVIKVIMTSAASDPADFQLHSTTALQKKMLAKT